MDPSRATYKVSKSKLSLITFFVTISQNLVNYWTLKIGYGFFFWRGCTLYGRTSIILLCPVLSHFSLCFSQTLCFFNFVYYFWNSFLLTTRSVCGDFLGIEFGLINYNSQQISIQQSVNKIRKCLDGSSLVGWISYYLINLLIVGCGQ